MFCCFGITQSNRLCTPTQYTGMSLHDKLFIIAINYEDYVGSISGYKIIDD